jgi:hypothetical protein
VHKATAHKLFDSSSDNANSYVCEECGEQFVVPSYLKHHIEKMHRTKTPSAPSSEISCRICDIKFETKYEHRIHLKTKEHQKKRRDPDNPGASRRIIQLNKKLKEEEEVKDPIKNQIEGARTCTICDVIFLSVLLKRKHERVAHPQIRNHMCEVIILIIIYYNTCY